MGWNFIDIYDKQHIANYDLANLKMDHFYLNINLTSFDEEVYLYTLNRECVDCPYLLKHYSNDTPFKTNLKFRLATERKDYFPTEQTNSVVCDINYKFSQFGIYSLSKNSTQCLVTTLQEPVNIYSPILTVCLIYALVSLSLYVINYIWKKSVTDNKQKNEDKSSKKERIKSLDTFRGIVILLMIFANFGCGGYEFIDHAIWNGLHLADLVFPSFMWIMGVCIPISLSSLFKKHTPNKTIVIKVLKRSIKLFFIGIFLSSGTDLSYLRIFGVLQRFGIVYLIVTIICIYTMERSTQQYKDDDQISIKDNFIDILKLYKTWIIGFLFLIFHTLILFTIAAPECPKGYMGPGGLHLNRSYEHCIGGATGYIDELILGNHRYQWPTIYEVYEAKPFDPEGVLGCLTTIFQVLLGVQAGTTLIVYKNHKKILLRWLTWAVITGLIGGALCGFSKEGGLIPVNKNLWSISFVLITSCLAFFLLSICYILIDVRKWWSGKPFLFAGMNAILLYVGHSMTGNNFPIRWYPHDTAGNPRRTHFVALLSDTWAVTMWLIISYYLFKVKYFFVV